MEVLIHGTKGGYRLLFKTPGAPSIISDIRNNVSSEAAVGKFAYSISFAANGYNFTKYLIIRDALRSEATGYIAFSLFLLFNQELQNKGADVKSILDELSGHYLHNYIRNNSINNGETNIIQEDWSFVAKILTRKKEQSNNQTYIKNFHGSKEAAFIYYENDSILEEYFSKPFQPEYNDYRQVLLISREFHNSSSDLLNVLRNSGVELNVDLKNEFYYLNNYEPSLGLTIYVNGTPFSNVTKSNIVRAKDKVEIKYVKKYHRPIEEIGILSNTASDIYKYLEKRGNQIFIKYEALANTILERPFVKNITFKILNWNLEEAKGAKVICQCGAFNYPVDDSFRITIKGDDLGKPWTISAYNNRLSSEQKVIYFDKELPEENILFEIFLNTHELKIKLIDDSTKDEIKKYKISATRFIDDEIGKTHQLSVESEGYDPYHFSYDPLKTEINSPIPLRRKEKSLESKNWNPSDKNTNEEGASKSDKKNKTSNKEGGASKKKLLIALLTLAVLVIVVSLFYYVYDNSINNTDTQTETINNSQKQDSLYIKEYIEGDSLILASLNKYKDDQENLNSTISDSLQKAIKRRMVIDSLNFSAINGLYYYPKQQKFFSAIKNINSSDYNRIRRKLGDISSWSLRRIADTLNAILSTINYTDEYKVDSKNDSNKLIKEEAKERISKPLETKQNDNERMESTTSKNSIQSKNISDKLQGETISQTELQSFNNAEGMKDQNSIDLYLRFWNLVLGGNTSKGEFDKLSKDVKSNTILKNSKLNEFLNSICKDSKTFVEAYERKIIRVRKTPVLTLKKLKDELNAK